MALLGLSSLLRRSYLLRLSITCKKNVFLCYYQRVLNIKGFILFINKLIMKNVRECPVLPGYFFRRDGMFSVGTPEGPFWKGYACKLSGKYYRRIKTVDGQSKLVHRMIGFTFCYNPLPKVFTFCDHVNGDTDDNSDTNIRWVTQFSLSM